MKKVKIISLLVVVAAVLFYFIFNRFDTTLNPQAYTLADLNQATFDPSNGFYILWGLGEPADVDIMSEDYRASIRQLVEKTSENNGTEKILSHDKYKMNFNTFDKVLNRLAFSSSFTQDWITTQASQTQQLEEAQEQLAVLLDRYRKLIAAPVYEEFTPPQPFAQHPNLLAWLKTARFYTAVCTEKAVKGQWEEGTHDLLAHIQFARRAHVGGRSLILNLMAGSCLNISLQGLVSIMNHPQCPQSVYSLVLAQLTPLKYSEYGNRQGLINDCLGAFAEIDDIYNSKLPSMTSDFTVFDILPPYFFLQRNRTKNYFYDFYSLLISYDEKDPYLWEFKDSIEIETQFNHKKSFWWLQNPLGKIICSSSMPYMHTIIHKTNIQRSLYDMTRLLAELQLKYTPGSDVAAILPQLESYKVLDPCSGKPYIWNSEKNLFYSIGSDRIDQGGIESSDNWRKTDFVVPVVIKKM